MGGAVLYGSGSRNDLFNLTMPVALFWGILILTIFIRIAKAFNVKQEIIIITLSLVMFAVGYLSAKETWLPLSIQAGACGVLFLSTGCIYKLNGDKTNEMHTYCGAEFFPCVKLNELIGIPYFYYAVIFFLKLILITCVTFAIKKCQALKSAYK